MSGWLLGIVGVVSLGVLLDILLPEGQTNKYIKGIFGIVVVAVIVAPLPALISGEQGGLWTDSFIEADSGYVADINADRNELREKQLKDRLNAMKIGVSDVYIAINPYTYKADYAIIYVERNASDDDTATCKRIAANMLGIEENEVKVYAE